ncbi:MAG: DUF998 domain-containing protein [Beijerinckiaceae bacterium]
MDITAFPKKIEGKVDWLKENPPAILRKYVLPLDIQPGDDKQPDPELVQHMLKTYRLLRLGMGWMAIAYPFVLVVLGLVLFNVQWQNSISDYYYALAQNITLPEQCLGDNPLPNCGSGWVAKAAEMQFPLRSFFCGGLIAIGFFLILYKGIRWLEDWALNFAGLFAIGVAIFPMDKPPYVSVWPTNWHFISAILLFVCMWFIARFCAKDTLDNFNEGSPEIARYTRIYKWLSRAMLGVLFAGLIYFLMKKFQIPHFSTLLFVIEASGVVVFGTYWVIKSKEINKHEFGRKS